jgi:hypothetical protein
LRVLVLLELLTYFGGVELDVLRMVRDLIVKRKHRVCIIAILTPLIRISHAISITLHG